MAIRQNVPIWWIVIFAIYIGTCLPTMPAADEIQNLSPSSGSALLPHKGCLSRVSSQDNETTIPTSSRGISFYDFIRDNANYIRQIVETYRERFGCVLLCFYTLATNCYAFTHENVFLDVNFCLVCRSIRVQVRTTASFTREVKGDVQRIVGYFQTMRELTNSSTNIDIDGILCYLDSQIEKFNARGSGFTIKRILEFTIVITKYRPLHGRCYIPTPRYPENNQCIVNVRNEDEKCFLWAVLSCLHEAPPPS